MPLGPRTDEASTSFDVDALLEAVSLLTDDSDSVNADASVPALLFCLVCVDFNYFYYFLHFGFLPPFFIVFM